MSSSTFVTVSSLVSAVVAYAEKLFADDVTINRSMGRHGAEHILKGG